MGGGSCCSIRSPTRALLFCSGFVWSFVRFLPFVRVIRGAAHKRVRRASEGDQRARATRACAGAGSAEIR